MASSYTYKSSGYTSRVWDQWTYNSSNTVTYTLHCDPWKWQTGSSLSTAWNDFERSNYVWYKTCQEEYRRTPEEQEAYEAERVRQREVAYQRSLQYKAEQEAAEVKAETLLVEHLEPEEAQRWAEQRQIHVRTRSGRRFCIKGHKRMHNIFELNEEGKEIKELCVYARHPDGDQIPLADNVLAQKLGLEHAEEVILSRANSWDLVRS